MSNPVSQRSVHDGAFYSATALPSTTVGNSQRIALELSGERSCHFTHQASHMLVRAKVVLAPSTVTLGFGPLSPIPSLAVTWVLTRLCHRYQLFTRYTDAPYRVIRFCKRDPSLTRSILALLGKLSAQTTRAVSYRSPVATYGFDPAFALPSFSGRVQTRRPSVAFALALPLLQTLCLTLPASSIGAG